MKEEVSLPSVTLLEGRWRSDPPASEVYESRACIFNAEPFTPDEEFSYILEHGDVPEVHIDDDIEDRLFTSGLSADQLRDIDASFTPFIGRLLIDGRPLHPFASVWPGGICLSNLQIYRWCRPSLDEGKKGWAIKEDRRLHSVLAHPSIDQILIEWKHLLALYELTKMKHDFSFSLSLHDVEFALRYEAVFADVLCSPTFKFATGALDVKKAYKRLQQKFGYLNFRLVEPMNLYLNQKKALAQPSPSTSEKGLSFEREVEKLLSSMGFHCDRTALSGDFGVDLLVEFRGNRLALQIKNYSANVGVEAVQQVASGKAYYKCGIAAVISASDFTDSAKELALVTGVQLITIHALKAELRKSALRSLMGNASL